jgi:hypothetical protein
VKVHAPYGLDVAVTLGEVPHVDRPGAHRARA